MKFLLFLLLALRSIFAYSAAVAELELCPVCQCNLDYDLKAETETEPCMMFNRCLHGIHIYCALSLIDHATSSMELGLNSLACPLCRRLLEQKQLKRICPIFEQLCDEEVALIDARVHERALEFLFRHGERTGTNF